MTSVRRFGRIRRGWLAACSAAFVSLPIAVADNAAPAAKDDVDQDLLEFLGSVDAQDDDSSWFDFLRSADFEKMSKRKTKPTAPLEKK